MLRIMVTGKNRKIASDVSKHLESDRGYTPIKCPAAKTPLLDMVLSEMPHVIIVCAGNETADTVKVYDILKESTKAGFSSIIVIANDEDKKCFIDNTKLKKISFLSRPVSLTALYTKLEELEEKYKAKNELDISMISEFENELEEFPRKHILVVDDDSEQLAAIKENLMEFYEVTLINKGKNVFRYLEKYKVDLILLDYMMPEMSGSEVLKLLRAHPDYKDIPIVFLTGVSDKDTVIKTLVELKPQGYILKPSNKSEMVAKIIDVLG